MKCNDEIEGANPLRSSVDLEKGRKKLVVTNFDDMANKDWRKLFTAD